MDDREMRGLLGPAYDDTTPDQRALIDRACDTLDRRWPGVDYTDIRTTAMNGMLEVVLGDTTDTDIAADWIKTRDAEEAARARLTGAIIAAREGGESEHSIAARLHVNRGTVRKALAK